MKVLPFLIVALPGLALFLQPTRGNDIPPELVIAQEAYLKATNPGAGDNFGRSVAVSGNTVVVGAPGKSPASGSAFVFVFDGSSWKQQALLKASNAGAGDEFGGAVAILGDTVVVGAKREDSHVTGTASIQGQLSNSATDAGAVYVFVRNHNTWTQEACIKASNTGAQDFFGTSVALTEGYLIIGAPGEDSSATGVNGSQTNNSAPDSGAAYIFDRNTKGWTQRAYLKASNTGGANGSIHGDAFGDAVAISGNTAVVGAWIEGSSATGVDGDPSNNLAPGSGAAYVFARTSDSWIQQAYLKASNTGTNDSFGYSVAISADTIVVGAWGESHLATDAGAAYVFTRNASTWSQQAYLKAANAAKDAGFGRSVAVWEDRIIVGASGESNLAYGSNGVRLSDAIQSGATYQFNRSADLWTQKYYLKASNTTKSDYFGNSVAISADRIVVGAYLEDSTSTINGYEGDRTENLQTNTGAAYVFGESVPLTPQDAFAKATAAAGWTGPDAAVTATPLDDGIPNLLKYASNLNLGFKDERKLTYYWDHAGLPLIRTVTNGGAKIFQVEYLRRRRSGLIYTPKVSSTLMPGSFVPLTGTPVVTPINDEWERVVIQEAADPLPSPTKFAVVEVNLP